MKQFFVHEKGSDTIRLMPKNYVVLVGNGARWVMDPDKAITVDFAAETFKAFFTIGGGAYLAGDLIAEILNEHFDSI